MKIKKIFFFFWGGGGGSGWEGQGRCEQRSEVFVKIKKKIEGGGGVVSGRGGFRLGGGVRVDVNEELKGVGLGGGQDGCERRIKVFVKIQKIYFFLGGWGIGLGGGGGQGRCEQRSEVFVKIKKKNCGGGSGWGGQGGCEQRSEVFVKIKKKIVGGGVGSRRGVQVGGRGQGGCE